MKPFRAATLLLVTLLLLSLACNLPTAISGGDEARDTAPDEAEPAQTAATEQAPSATSEDASGTGPEDEIAQPAGQVGGTDNLDSFRSTLAMRWEERSNGDTVVRETEMETARTREPAAAHVILTTADAGETMSSEFIQIEETLWVLTDGDWIQIGGQTLDEMLSGMPSKPEELLAEIASARRARPDQKINGISCRHYRFYESGINPLSLAEFTGAEGDYWVADQPDLDPFVVKYEASMEGVDFDGNSVQATVFYEVWDVNQPASIEPPMQAAGDMPLEDVPLPPEAIVAVAGPGFANASSDLSVAQATAFYEERMPDMGWQLAADPTTMDGFSLLEYGKDQQTATITISAADEGGCTIMLTLEE